MRARHHLFGSDQVYRSKGSGAQLAHLGPLNFQPAQLAVEAGIIVLAFFQSIQNNAPDVALARLRRLLVRPPFDLDEPDLGEVIIWVPVLLACFIGGMRCHDLHSIVLFAMIPITETWCSNAINRAADRICAHPDIDKRGSSWRLINRSSHRLRWLVGKGQAANTQIELGFLPATAVHNDYLFRNRRAVGLYRQII
jgi:cell division protein FtsW (lipid II flippase)